MSLIRSKAKSLTTNRLFEWLADDSVDPAERLTFVPMMLDFVMGFRDFNKYFVRYESPRDALEAALNEHAAEDETHSALLVQDWTSLATDQRLRWAPRDLFWWMTSASTEPARRVDFELIHMIWSNTDPLLRFAIVESMEAAGQVFFRRTVALAEAVERSTGRPMPYFGKYHLDRETGHLQHADERVFLRSRLDDDRRAKAKALVERVFQIFWEHFDSWESYARAVHAGSWASSPSQEGRVTAAMRPDAPRDVSAFMKLDHPHGLSGVGAELAAERDAAYRLLWESPGYKWVREAFPGDFHGMVRYFLLQWVVDNWACADYFTFDTTYPEPRSALERGINRLSLLYGSEMKRRYVEWETLRFDEYTGWTVTEALRHYWLDAKVETHRAIFADLRKLTFRHPEPLYRYWILKCFVGFGDTLMRSLGHAMREAREPNENFITFAGFPERLHPDLPRDPEADQAIGDVERRPLTEADVAVLREIIAETRDQEMRRSDVTWEIVKEGRFRHFHDRWEKRGGQATGHEADVAFLSGNDRNLTCV